MSSSISSKINTEIQADNTEELLTPVTPSGAWATDQHSPIHSILGLPLWFYPTVVRSSYVCLHSSA